MLSAAAGRFASSVCGLQTRQYHLAHSLPADFARRRARKSALRFPPASILKGQTRFAPHRRCGQPPSSRAALGITGLGRQFGVDEQHIPYGTLRGLWGAEQLCEIVTRAGLPAQKSVLSAVSITCSAYSKLPFKNDFPLPRKNFSQFIPGQLTNAAFLGRMIDNRVPLSTSS